MIALLFSLAHAAPPEASAIISADGQYALILQPPQGWQEAEIAISGDGASDVGPAEAGTEVRIEGYLDKPGVIWVNVQAALDDNTGVNWVFSVDPEIVPASSPKMERMSRRTLRWCPFKRRKG